MSTTNIPPNGGKATGCHPEERPFRFGAVAVPGLKGNEPSHAVCT